MRDTGLLRHLIARACTDIDREADGARVGHGAGENPQAIGKRSFFKHLVSWAFLREVEATGRETEGSNCPAAIYIFYVDFTVMQSLGSNLGRLGFSLP